MRTSGDDGFGDQSTESVGADRTPYADLQFPQPPPDRPYVFINMVTTIDGKILTGERDEPVMDLGSKVDHEAMRRIERATDGVMIGAGSLRATKGLWYPRELARIVVTGSGEIPTDGRFFTDAPDRAFVCTEAPIQLPAGVRRLPLDLPDALRVLRQEHGIAHLLCEGGSELNASLLSADLVDELFLTVAPKIKLGRDVPTYADGMPLPREQVQRYGLLTVDRVGDEVFLRYRRESR